MDARSGGRYIFSSMLSSSVRAGAALLFCGSLIACSGDDIADDFDTRDGGAVTDRDAGQTADRDAGTADSGVVVDRDAGPRDAGEVRDGGTPLSPELVPGQYVQVMEGRIEIGVDTLATVEAKLGMGTRNTTMNARSFEWSLSGGVTLTVWFANTGIGPVGTIADDAQVLWVSVQDGYTGETPNGVGLGATRAEIEAALGVAPHEVPITATPTGTLLQYMTSGILVALNDQGAARTITISRAYPVEPDGEIDPRGTRIRLSNGDLEGFGGLGNRGTDISRVRQRLGEPDTEGDVNVGGQSLHTLSYAFIGIEVFQVDNAIVGEDKVAFFNIHAPYYGTGAGGVGIGSARADFEGFLSNQGYGNGTMSSTANFFCYTHPSAESVGVSYTADAPARVSSVTIPLLQCP